MARVSIYVPDDLKARMDATGEAANWSEIVRPAIRAAVASHEHHKGANMSTVIERLRASKQLHIQDEAKFGGDAGRKWAQDRAQYGELKRVSALAASTDSVLGLEELRLAIDPEDILSPEDFANAIGALPHEVSDLSDEWADAFIRGAASVFDEIKDQL